MDGRSRFQPSLRSNFTGQKRRVEQDGTRHHAVFQGGNAPLRTTARGFDIFHRHAVIPLALIHHVTVHRIQMTVDSIARSLGHLFLHGRGIGKDASWPSEESVLVIGVDRDSALELGRTFGQLAIVYKEIHQPAELLLCDE